MYQKNQSENIVVIWLIISSVWGIRNSFWKMITWKMQSHINITIKIKNFQSFSRQFISSQMLATNQDDSNFLSRSDVQWSSNHFLSLIWFIFNFLCKIYTLLKIEWNTLSIHFKYDYANIEQRSFTVRNIEDNFPSNDVLVIKWWNIPKARRMRERKKWMRILCSFIHTHISSSLVSISSTFYTSFFCTKVFCAAFL